MGFHKKIRDHGPIVYYTFDPKETYGDTYTGIGVFGNKVETEFPPLTMKNTGLTYIHDKLDFISPSLAKIELFSLYKSVSTGSPKLTTDVSRNVNDTNPISFTYNNHSMIYESVLSQENINEMKSGFEGVYTIFFQIKAYPIEGISSIQYTNAFNEYLEPISHFGTATHCILTTNRTFDEDIISSFGVSSELVGEQLIKATCNFGFEMKGNVYIKQWDPKAEFKPLTPIMFYKGASYNISEMSKEYLSFGFVKMNINTYKNPSNNNMSYSLNFPTLIGLSSNQNVGYNPGISCSSDIATNIFLEIDENRKLIRWWDGKTYMGEYIYSNELEFSNIIKIGYRSRWDRHNIQDNDIFESNESKFLRKANFPISVVEFDNFAIFNKTLTEKEKNELMDSNTPYEEFYSSRGFNQLYDFKGLYNNHKRLLENSTSIPNIFGSSNLTLLCSTSDLPYIEYLQNDPRLDHYLILRKNASIQSNRNTFGRPVSIMGNSGTLTFMFKTIDGNGVLFFNGKYENSSRNLMLLFSYDYLEIWHGNSLYGRISGLNNNEWHYVDIIYNNLSTKIYIDEILYHDSIQTIANEESLSGFGNCLPGNTGLDVELAMIAQSNLALNLSDLKALKNNRTIYSASGQVTLNNIAIGTTIFVYNRDTGALIERLTTSSENGNFVYYNKTPNTLTIVVADSTLTQGSSYIVDPIELQ